MRRNATQSIKGIASKGSSTKAHAAQFIGVVDSRNRRIAGLYLRNGRYYAQLWVDREDGKKTARRFPLLTPEGLPVDTLTAAKTAADVLRNDRRNRELPASGHKPRFADYVETYFAKPETQAKKPDTLKLERWTLGRWKKHLGDLRIDRIEESHISSLRHQRRLAGVSIRTANLDELALRNVLKAAKEDGLIRKLPDSKMKKSPRPARRPLVTPAQFEALLAAVPTACEKNAVQFADYLRFLAYTGAREQEALKVRWRDVDLEGGKVTIGAGGVSKNGQERTVNFNAKLEALLKDMVRRQAPDCSWLFPSPQRGPRDEHARTFRESLLLARTAAGLPWFGFHDCRHRFASVCVMAGLDYMTIAEWLGHQDGGILVGKTYGHLADTHKVEAAAKLRLL